MNWPADRSEQIKLVAMIVILSIVGLYVAFLYGLSPLLRRQHQHRDRTETLEDLLWRAERDIDLMPQNRRLNREIVDEILASAADGRYVLRSSLGNYLLVAREIVVTKARRLGLRIDNVREITPPSPELLRRRDAHPPEPDRWFKPYTVAVTLESGVLDLARLLDAIESENPFLCITAIEITGRPATPELHAISFSVTWPIWADEIWPEILARQLAMEEDEP